jgi:hypothetical protein
MADESRERIAAVVREVADLVARSGADPAELDTVAADLEKLAARLRSADGHTRRARSSISSRTNVASRVR